MASQVKQQADAIVAIIQGTVGSPGLVEWRKTDGLRPNRDNILGDPDDAVIVTGGIRRTGPERAFEGSVGVEYMWQISVFGRETPDVKVEDDAKTSFVERVKKALSQTILTDAPNVWDFEVTDHDDWGVPSFRQGVEVSRFGVLYRTWEPQN